MRTCYGSPLHITAETVAGLWLGARVLGMAEAFRAADAFLLSSVLPHFHAALTVLAACGPVSCMPPAILGELVNRCLTSAAGRFEWHDRLHDLPPDMFACLIRTALEANSRLKTLLETAVGRYLAHRAVSGVSTQREHFIVVSESAGRLSDIDAAADVFTALEPLMAEVGDGTAQTDLCEALCDVGLWECLPHDVIARAFQACIVPYKYIAIAALAENRQLRKVHDLLADEVGGWC